MTLSPDLKDEQQFPGIMTQSIQSTQGQDGHPHCRGHSRSRIGSRSRDRSQSRGRSSSRGHPLGKQQPGNRSSGQMPGVQFEITDSNPGRTHADATKGSWAERAHNGAAEVMTAENVGDSRAPKKRAVTIEHAEAKQTTMLEMKGVLDTLSKVVANLSEQMGKLQ
ncbi:hypothetical protein HPB52_021227 [Rhipicephalus sanguineus]|uniref:Uncharacterized protein n=1 Tax=Rhipicephalus sanguineus TaxID=34632 RepID=A0A9D4Q3K3_RHISA|nr:hypothetical protein HPB52_021227 [Rhipicephalus sanguineus]